MKVPICYYWEDDITYIVFPIHDLVNIFDGSFIVEAWLKAQQEWVSERDTLRIGAESEGLLQLKLDKIAWTKHEKNRLRVPANELRQKGMPLKKRSWGWPLSMFLPQLSHSHALVV